MKDERIQIRGNREGINAIIDTEQFSNFDEMIGCLVDKLAVGASFYKGAVLKITADLKKYKQNEIDELKNILFEKVEIKECLIELPERLEIKPKDEKEITKVFNGVYEGKTKFIRKTVRGGQCISYPGNIVIIGDINSGSEVNAGGNIIVLGTIKGKVHAGVSGNLKAIISAFNLQPEILQIGDILTISPENQKPQYPELAKVRDGLIIVEPYLPKKYI
ncbi:MAG: septum site-determining protein MinC [Clostridium sp.]|uniref:septum site-determining protein MinC n=1 Tax=Clostridium sp. TaxID=1506 RepID=UPI003021463F